MRDMHCHILPGVDDGSRDATQSLRMFEAARSVGIDSITCTPHCRDPYFDFDGMWEAFHAFESMVHEIDAAFPLQMGFEVAHDKLMDLGIEWARRLAFNDSDEFLLELSVNASPSRFGFYERTIFELQGQGLTVIIAHPERYVAIQKDPQLAVRLHEMGCMLQASAGFITRSILSPERALAKKLFKRGLYDFVASDAHRTDHYTALHKAMHRWG